MARKITRYPVEGPNALWQIYRTVSPFKGVKNFILSRSPGIVLSCL